MAENKNFSNFIKLFVQVRTVCQTRAINFQLMPVRHKNNFMAYYFFFLLFFSSPLFLCISNEGTKNNAIKQINFPINLFEAGRKKSRVESMV